MRTIIPEQDNPILRHVARAIPVSDISSDHIKSLISDMRALLAKEKHGVALAAPQVGESIRLFVVAGRALTLNDAEEDSDSDSRESRRIPDDLVYINPEVVKTSRLKRNKHEGCLSIRGYWGIVPRAEKMTIRAYDQHGVQITRGTSGFLAHIFQHEIDHLNGILYTDTAIEIHDESSEQSS